MIDYDEEELSAFPAFSFPQFSTAFSSFFLIPPNLSFSFCWALRGRLLVATVGSASDLWPACISPSFHSFPKLPYAILVFPAFSGLLLVLRLAQDRGHAASQLGRAPPPGAAPCDNRLAAPRAASASAAPVRAMASAGCAADAVEEEKPIDFIVGAKVTVTSPSRMKRRCTIVMVEGDRVKVHYDGFDPVHDEWLLKDSERISEDQPEAPGRRGAEGGNTEEGASCLHEKFGYKISASLCLWRIALGFGNYNTCRCDLALHHLSDRAPPTLARGPHFSWEPPPSCPAPPSPYLSDRAPPLHWLVALPSSWNGGARAYGRYVRSRSPAAAMWLAWDDSGLSRAILGPLGGLLGPLRQPSGRLGQSRRCIGAPGGHLG